MKNSLFALIFGLVFYSCAPSKTFVDTSCSGYKSIDIERNDLNNNGISIMPVLGAEGKEQYRRPMGDAITKQLRNSFQTEKVLSPSQVIDRINESNLTNQYTQAIQDYQMTGIIPKDAVIKIGNSLNSRYLLYTRLLADSETEVISTGYSYGYGYSYTQIKVDELFLECQVWDTSIGDVVWEGKGGTAKLSSEMGIDIVDNTAKGLEKVILTEKGFGACETKDQIFDSVKAAQVNTYLAIMGAGIPVAIIAYIIALSSY